ncbi:hypothetical protein BRYFOR_09100 [Marvinbryantia formatexigens DSM 14469]|uniref:Uncharacterized protein n=1 Tax=Marvinbryantia formatexigens DSM 14469 TaxID=478749 RepID=C6LKB3_9FIRM|nr:hypothetical protein BRYFOR_09100 [Marvinbryantia formatexigens DSM 14469]
MLLESSGSIYYIVLSTILLNNLISLNTCILIQSTVIQLIF